MKKATLVRVLLCAVIFGVLIASAFVDTTQKPTGNAVAVGSYANGNPAADEAAAADAAAEVAQKRTFADVVADANNFLNDIAWGIFMCVLLVGTGAYISARTGFLQFRRFGYMMRSTVGRLFRREKADVGEGEITPFQALCTALAGTVGTGNIAGVTGAIVLGGPGAVFWMWVAALMGMCTKYAEIVLAVKYREKNAKGEWVGGPMYYMKNGLGKGWGWLAVMFAAFGALASFGIGSMTQVNTIAGTFVTAIDSVTATVITGTQTEAIVRWVVGVVIAALVALVVIGGIKRLGSVAEKIVPAMSVFYIIGSLIVIFSNIGNLGMVFKSIFQAAFTPEAAFGGVTGFVLMNAIKRGVGRGVFSNEAGLGSAPIAHANSSETEPVRQGLYGVFEVFADTIVICTMTSLVVLTSNIVPWGNADMAGADTTILAFGTVLGPKASSIFIAIAILFFAFSTILSWSLYGQRCFAYLTKGRGVIVYQIAFIATVVIGATLKLSLVWNIADTMNGFMAVPNLIALLALSGTVVKLTKEHFNGDRLSR